MKTATVKCNCSSRVDEIGEDSCKASRADNLTLVEFIEAEAHVPHRRSET
jgi:hypothetical protein